MVLPAARLARVEPRAPTPRSVLVARDGLDAAVVDALRSRRFDHLSVIEPSIEQLTGQLREELTVSRRHLRSMLATYWENDWRWKHKGFGESPEDHLWRAATAVSEITDALDGLCLRRRPDVDADDTD